MSNDQIPNVLQVRTSYTHDEGAPCLRAEDVNVIRNADISHNRFVPDAVNDQRRCLYTCDYKDKR
jgi:hypothetical protein